MSTPTQEAVDAHRAELETARASAQAELLAYTSNPEGPPDQSFFDAMKAFLKSNMHVCCDAALVSLAACGDGEPTPECLTLVEASTAAAAEYNGVCAIRAGETS